MADPKFAYIPITNTGGALGDWEPGETRYYTYNADTTPTCEAAKAEFLALSPAQKLAKTSTSPPGNSAQSKEWVDYDCALDVWPTYVTADNALYIPPDDETPDPVGPNPDPVVTATISAGMNPEVFAPALQWQNGKARLVNNASLNGNVLYFRSGQPPISSLPTTYDYSPNDVICMQIAVTNTPYLYLQAWNQKAMFNLKVGPAPN